jgi:hypothetical protein
MRVVLYNVLIEFGVTMKLVQLNKLHLSDAHCNICTGKHFCYSLRIQNGVKQGDVLTRLLLIFAMEHAFRIVKGNEVGLKLNGTY